MNSVLRFFLTVSNSILFLGASLNVFGYSGMSASVAQKSKGWNVEGKIVIAIMENDVITSEEVIYDGNDGYCPRFSPEGDKVAFSTGSKLKICNIDGSDLKEYSASGWEVSWIRGDVIWIHGGRWSKSNAMKKYDAKTGELLASSTLPDAMQQYYVAANGKFGAGTGSGLNVYYNTIDGDKFGAINKFGSGCSSGPSPEGKYLMQNTWPHQTFNIYEMPGPKQIASINITKNASSVGLGSGFIWNHQLMAGHCDVGVLPVGKDVGDHQLKDSQYPCFYDITEKKLLWMTKTKPGGNLVTHPYDFFKGLPGPPKPSLNIAPESSRIEMSASTKITATLKNFEGTVPEVKWTVSGGAVNPATGTSVTFTPGTYGKFTITATAGELTKTVVITAFDPDQIHLMINCGGGEVEDWTGAGSYASGGESFDFGSTPGIEGLKDPAPAQVYSTVYHSAEGSHKYDFNDLPDGDYTVRLHFIDHNDGRSMSFSIEGEKVIEGYDPPGSPEIKEFVVTVDDGNGLQIDCESAGGDDVFLAGIEIIRLKTTVFSNRQTTRGAGMSVSITRAGGTYLFDISLSGYYHLDIINLLGATVQRIDGNGTSRVSWTPAAAFGVYMMRLVAENRIIASKTIMVR